MSQSVASGEARELGIHISLERITIGLCLCITLGSIFIWTYRLIAQGNLLVKVRRVPPHGHVPVECGRCQCVQYAPQVGAVFLCCRCHTSNNVPLVNNFFMAEGLLHRFDFSLISPTFYKITNKTLIWDRRTSITSSFSLNAKVEPRHVKLPPCHICVERPGCMVLVPCGHSGLCESCAIRIVQDWNGGSKCPSCRHEIELLVKLDDMSPDNLWASGHELRVPIMKPLPPCQESDGEGALGVAPNVVGAGEDDSENIASAGESDTEIGENEDSNVLDAEANVLDAGANVLDAEANVLDAGSNNAEDGRNPDSRGNNALTFHSVVSIG